MSAAGPLRTLLVISLAAAALCPRARASAWELDPAATRIEFSVRNLSVAHVDGRFRLTSGRVTLVDEDPSRSTVEAVIDATSVDTGEPKRDTHLRSADFLDVDHHPSNRFCSPSDTGCDNPPLSNMGAMYEHTFAQAGMFPYYCSVHFSLGMTGTITVQ
jgi:polyisoprenoid-binding protein YceI